MKNLKLLLFLLAFISFETHATFNYWFFGKNEGSYDYWRNGRGVGSEYYWKNGKGPGSQSHWLTKTGPGSKSHWFGNTLTYPSHAHWLRGEGIGSQRTWNQHKMTFGTRDYWIGGPATPSLPTLTVTLCMAKVIDNPMCDYILPSPLTADFMSNLFVLQCMDINDQNGAINSLNIINNLDALRSRNPDLDRTIRDIDVLRTNRNIDRNRINPEFNEGQQRRP